MNIKEIAKEIHANNVEKGFWDNKGTKNVGEALMLVVTELSEALEADRSARHANISRFNRDISFDGKSRQRPIGSAFEDNIKDTFEDEIADAIIRLLDISEGFEIDIETHIRLKTDYNKTRPSKHGKRY